MILFKEYSLKLETFYILFVIHISCKSEIKFKNLISMIDTSTYDAHVTCSLGACWTCP